MYFKYVTVLSLPLLLLIKQISDRHLALVKGIQHYADSVNDKNMILALKKLTILLSGHK